MIVIFSMFSLVACKECKHEFTNVTYCVQFEGLTESQTIQEGCLATAPTSIPTKAGYIFVGWNFDFNTQITSNITINAIFEKKYLDLPVLLIDTENNQPVDSKETYIKFTASIENAKELFSIENVTGKIKGRGNSTWDVYEKKPYKIKFDEKIDLFGNGKAKEWTLIANHGDKSLIRNYLAYEMASVFSKEMPFTTTTQFVELYLNNEYLGVYLICEQNETGKNRVDIDDEYSNNPDISYFVELDGRAYGEGNEGGLYFKLNGLPYAVKSPDEEDDTNRNVHMEYIKDYFIQCYQALKSGNYELVKNLIDVESFASSYIINELFNCKDVGQSSFYMYKPKGDKLYSGPIWDYDISSGNVENYHLSNSPEQLWAKEINPWYMELLQYEEFRSLVAEKLSNNAVKLQKIKVNCISIAKGQSSSFERNFEKWDVMGKNLWPNPPELVAIDTWEGQVDYLDKWLDDSLSYLLQQYCE